MSRPVTLGLIEQQADRRYLLAVNRRLSHAPNMRYWLLLWVALTVAVPNAIPAENSPVYTPPAFADPDRLAKIENLLPQLDALYLAHATNRHLPGFVYGVVVDGKLIHTLAWGNAQLAPDHPVETDTRFRIASMTKSFTALAILKLRDAGKLSLDDTIEKYVPQFAKVKPLTTDSPKIAIRHLLRMAGGFPQDDPWGDRRLADSVAELESLVAGGLNYSNPPGVKWEYSNLGFGLLGHVVTKVARRPYQEFITREILVPLGMTDTVWEFSQVPTNKLALGYRWEHERFTPEPILHDGTFGAMGGLITTVTDFSRYVAMHLDAWPPRDDAELRLVRRATLREMHRPAELIAVNTNNFAGLPIPEVLGYSYGLRWNMDARGLFYVRHTGGLPGFGSEYRFLPEYGVGVIAFANLTYAPMVPVNSAAIELLLSAAKLQPRFPVASPMLKTRATQLARIVQDWNPADVTDALAPNVFQDKSREDWQAFAQAALVRAGPIQSVSEVTPENQLRGKFTMRGTQGSIEVFFTLMPEQPPKVQELRLTFVANKAP